MRARLPLNKQLKSMDMTWKPHVTVAAVAELQGRFLLVQERDAGKRVLNQPAGHLEDGESLLAAVRREVLEETAWQFEPQALVGIYRWRHPETGITFMRFTFAGALLSHDSGRSLDPDIEQVVWLSDAEIRRQQHRVRSPLVLSCVRDYLAGKTWPLEILADLE
jgi:8-oxo-dGTP pyrophosphatase MutT (NUDIX family)